MADGAGPYRRRWRSEMCGEEIGILIRAVEDIRYISNQRLHELVKALFVQGTRIEQ